MIDKNSVNDLGIILMDTNEYFIPLSNYKTGSVMPNYIISNYGRVFSNNAGFWHEVNIRSNITPYTYKISIGCGKYRDVLSMTKLMIYNFDNNRYIKGTNYYLKDTDKLPTTDNIWDVSPLRSILTKEQKKELLCCIRKGMGYNWIIENHYDYPLNAMKRFLFDYYDERHRNKPLVKKRSMKLEKDDKLTKEFTDAISNITRDEIKKNYLTTIIKGIANDLNIRYSHSLYTRAYNYFTGNSSEARVFLKDKFND